MLFTTAIFSGLLTLILIKWSAHQMEEHFFENVPLGLMMMATLELNGFPWWMIAGLSVFLIPGIHFHTKGMHDGELAFKKRAIGNRLTLLGLALLAVANISWVSYLLIASIRFATSVYVN